jgi:ParB family chromosome partitioning protein
MTSRREAAGARERTGEQQTVPDPNVTAATRDMEAALGTRVRIVSQTPDRGRIEIEYFSVDELDRIYNLIVGGK